MPSDSKQSAMQDSSLTKEDMKKQKQVSTTCSICSWLIKLQDNTRKEIMGHMAKYHLPS